MSKISTRPSQKSILSGLVRKRPAETVSTSGSSSSSSTSSSSAATAANDEPNEKKRAVEETATVVPPVVVKAASECIAILPGIGRYQDSSDSENSSNTDEEYDYSDFDWLGRKITKNKCDE